MRRTPLVTGIKKDSPIACDEAQTCLRQVINFMIAYDSSYRTNSNDDDGDGGANER
jgi:hypothetical protein